MNATTGHTQGKVMRQAIRMTKVITLARLLRGLAMGALLSVGAALYFNMTSASEAPTLSATSQAEGLSATRDQQRVVDNMQKRLDEAVNASPGEQGGIYSDDNPYPYLTLEGFTHQLEQDEEYGEIEATRRSNWDRPPLDVAIERLERQINSMFADAARDPSKNTPSLNREIERLDYQIDMLRLNAMRDTSMVRPLSNSQAIESLEEQMSIMLFNAARASKPLSKEIERLERQIDRLLADAARDPSRNTPLLNREINRLDDQINMIRLYAMQHPKAEGKPRIFEETVLPGHYPETVNGQ